MWNPFVGHHTHAHTINEQGEFVINRFIWLCFYRPPNWNNCIFVDRVIFASYFVVVICVHSAHLSHSISFPLNISAYSLSIHSVYMLFIHLVVVCVCSLIIHSVVSVHTAWQSNFVVNFNSFVVYWFCELYDVVCANFI